MKDSLGSFYYDLLNINKNNDVVSTIETTIEKLKLYMQKNNIQSTMMCKVLTNSIYNDLKEKHVTSRVLNTYDLFNCYEHEFIIAHYKEEGKVKFILIDLTYEQFVKSENRVLMHYFKKFPSEYLGNSHVLIDLLKAGYSKISEQDFQDYLYSIHQDETKLNLINLEDVIYKSKAKK